MCLSAFLAGIEDEEALKREAEMQKKKECPCTAPVKEEEE